MKSQMSSFSVLRLFISAFGSVSCTYCQNFSQKFHQKFATFSSLPVAVQFIGILRVILAVLLFLTKYLFLFFNISNPFYLYHSLELWFSFYPDSLSSGVTFKCELCHYFFHFFHTTTLECHYVTLVKFLFAQYSFNSETQFFISSLTSLRAKVNVTKHFTKKRI